MFELIAFITVKFHFLRPAALLALLPALLLVALNHWRKRSAGNWEKVINPQLLPFLMQGDASTGSGNLLDSCGLDYRLRQWLAQPAAVAPAVHKRIQHWFDMDLSPPCWQRISNPVDWHGPATS